VLPVEGFFLGPLPLSPPFSRAPQPIMPEGVGCLSATEHKPDFCSSPPLGPLPNPIEKERSPTRSIYAPSAFPPFLYACPSGVFRADCPPFSRNISCTSFRPGRCAPENEAPTYLPPRVPQVSLSPDYPAEVIPSDRLPPERSSGERLSVRA